MKKRKGGLLQRMMAVLLSAVLIFGMMSNAAPISVLAQESVSENTPAPVEGETEPAEGEKEPAEETGSGEQEDPEKTEDEEKDPEGQEPGEGAEQEKPQPGDGKEETPEPGKEEEKGPESVSDNDAPAESVSENDAPTESVSENDAPTKKPRRMMRAAAGDIASGDGWVLAGDGTLTIESDVGMGEWTYWLNTHLAADKARVISVEIQDGVKYIADGAFTNCTYLESITIPESVESIGNSVFYGCVSLTEVNVEGEIPPTLGGNNVYNSCKFVTDKTKGIHVPEGRAQAYKDAWTEWAAYIADDTTSAEIHKHPVCGTSCGHSGMQHSDVEWKALTYTGGKLYADGEEIRWYGGGYRLDGNYYLADNLTIDNEKANIQIQDANVHLCLNGKEFNLGETSLWIYGKGELTLCDCAGNGLIKSERQAAVSIANITAGKRAFIMYGGLLQGSEYDFYSNYDDAEAKFLGGTVTNMKVNLSHDYKTGGFTTPIFIGQPVKPGTKIKVDFWWDEYDGKLPTVPVVKAGEGYILTETDLTNLDIEVIASGYTDTEFQKKIENGVIVLYQPVAEKHEHDGVAFTAWTKTDSLPTDAGNYYLTENVTLSNTWNVPNGTTTLCLNGKTITKSGSGRVIKIAVSGTLNLYDCQNTGMITQGRGCVKNGGTFNMYGGKIIENRVGFGADASGGGVNTDGGNFNMYGGEISKNQGYTAGGVSVGSGIFHMYGGKISENSAVAGYGGVFNYRGTFIVGGNAVISGNTYNGKENNVSLQAGKTIEIDGSNPLSGSAKIGVTTETAPTDGHPVDITGHNKDDYSQYFASDNPAYKIVNNDHVVQLTAPHTHSLTRVDAKAATCTADGNSAYYTCSGCDKWFSDAEGKQEITDKNSVKISKTGHSYDETAWGYKEEDGHAHICVNCDAHDEVRAHTPGAPATAATPQTCTVCGYIIAPVIGHTCSPQPVAKKEPTCTAAGKQAYYHCEGCGKNYEDAEGKDLIADISTWGKIDALGHDWGEWKVTKKATATKTGEKERTCKRCDEKETETIPATGGGSGGGDQGGTSDGGSGGNNGGAGGGSDSGSSGGSNSGGTSPTNPKPGASGTGQPKVKQEKKGNIQKEVRIEGGAAPDVEVATTLSDLVDIVLTETEKQQAEAGTNIRIVLDVKDASAVISAADRTIVEMALNGAIAKGYTLGQYLDITLYKVVGNSRSAITQTSRKITVTIQVPDSLRNTDSETARTFAVIRVHDGKAELLTDLDNEEDTVTIETDRFSTYAIVWQDTADGGVVRVRVENGGNKKSGGKDSEPKTGDATPIEPAATLSMIAGFTYLLLYFADRRHGMTEETKKELVSRLIGWGRRGGRIRRYLALAAIFVLLVYYHSIGKKTCVEWKEIYGE